jgi:hypothetical protein
VHTTVPWKPLLLWGVCATATGMTTVAAPVILSAPVLAQERDLNKPGPLEFISRGDRRVIRTQVEVAIRAAEMAVETLGQGTEAEDLARAKALARKSYVLLRYAQHGVGIIAEDDGRMASEKFLARIAFATVNEARERVRAGEMAIDNAIPWPETRGPSVEEAIQKLTDSIPVARRAAMLLLR